MPQSFVSRLVLLQQAGTMLVVSLFAVTALVLADRVLTHSDTERLRKTAEGLAESVDLEYAERGSVVDAVRDVMEESPLRVAGVRVEGPDGRTLLDQADSGGTVASDERGSGRGRVQLLEQASATARCGARVIVIDSTDDRRAALLHFKWALALSACPILVGVHFVSRRTARRALSPLLAMTEKAASAGPHARSIGSTGGLAELDALTLAFNGLLERLDDALNRERRFVADASHELRTPLTVIAGEIEAICSRSTCSVEERHALERIFEQVCHMREVVDALLVLRRAQRDVAEHHPEFEALNVSDSAREVALLLLARYADRARDLVIVAPEEAFVHGHPVLLAAAIRNLLDNAFKFSAIGQPVRATVRITLDGVAIEVDDAGPGIPESEDGRVFEPFYRGPHTHTGIAGSGLGLPLLREVARVHGGDVTVQSSDLGGARLVLRLPAWRGSTHPVLNRT